MTGQTPKYKTDDIRRSVGTMADSAPVIWVVTSAILAGAIALLVQSFGLGEPGGPADAWCSRIVAVCLAIFSVEVSLRLIAERVGFFGKIGNVALFLIVGSALFTPFDAVLMLRAFPLIRYGIGGRALPPAASTPLMLLWLAACFAAAAREVVHFEQGTCAGWIECVRTAATLMAP